MDIRKELREYFAKFYQGKINDTDNLFQLGALDSMGIMSLIQHCEDSLGISLEPDDITAENFESLHNIERLLIKKSPK